MFSELKRYHAFGLIVLLIMIIGLFVGSSNTKTRMTSLDPLPLPSQRTSDKNVNKSFWITQFREHELKVYSQNGEDGVLLWLFTNIGTVNHPPRFVEFGVENGLQCNTRHLRERLGWQGLMMDGSNENLQINLHREIITPKNINDLLIKYQTPAWIDLLSIDLE